jgi:similar to stage IV sporulation protein
MNWLPAFFGGRVEIRAQSNQLESFINQLHRRRISIFTPRRAEDGCLYCTLPARQFKRLRAPAFKTGTKIRIVKKRGLFIAIRPFRHRWGLAVGLALFLGLIFYFSGFIWRIEVSGYEDTSYTQILSDLEQLGLKIGCRNTINVGEIENLYLKGNEKLSWMSINIRGTTAYVEVKEEGVRPKVMDLSTPSNIYAARDGVILSIMDYGGLRQVEVGQAVSAGDLLVSGDHTDQYGVRRLTRSIATIKAQTVRKTEITIPLKEDLRQKTGKIQKKYAISLGNWKIPLYFNQKIGYNDYDTMEKVCPLRIGAFAMPIGWRVRIAEEVETVRIRRTPEEAKKEAQARLAFYESDRLSHALIRRREVEEDLSQDRLTLRVTFHCEEEIGVELPIQE